FQAEDGIRDLIVTGVQTCALPISQRQQQEQRERTVEAQERIARPSWQERGDAAPRAPGGAVEELGEAEAARHAPRQNNGLEGVPQDDRQQGDPDEADDPSHDRELSGPWGTQLCYPTECLSVALGGYMSIRPIKSIIQSQPTIEGAGVKLRRAFGFGDTGEFDPFLLLDDFRNEHPEDYLAGFPWHPHRGIETIT